ncbi:hypothetical protein HAX54_023438 [Datura stramonium]|uniref:RNase H type-1 domain-containing protein n=1 Tax=Datura stramonium TaxID=4076 RepID=A0ABS8S4T6_DATST|nr:hypothetical protein [Datura stramonium]
MDPPPPNVYKLNTDGAFSSIKQIGGIRRIIRDFQGCWEVGFSNISKATNHTAAKFEALEIGLHLALSFNFFPLEVETDSIEVLQNLDYPHLIFNSMVDSCRLLLKKLRNSPLRHSFQEANKVADFLAR